jgi:hypothetical protein
VIAGGLVWVALLLLGAGRAEAQIPGATYIGDHSGQRADGDPVERVMLRVSRDGSYVETLSLDGPIWYPASGYAGGDVTWESYAGAITNRRFRAVSDFVVCRYDPFTGSPVWDERYYVDGTFDGQRVTGTIRAETVDSCRLDVINEVSYDLTWLATTTAPAPPDNGTPPDDNEVNNPQVTAVKKQVQGGRWIKVKVKAGAQERVTAKATGKVKVKGKRTQSYKLQPQVKSIDAGAAKVLRLKPTKRKYNRKIFKAIKNGKKVRAPISVKLTDEAGNSVRAKRVVQLK